MQPRTALAACLAAAVVAVAGWLWWSSLLPGRYSVMDMGYVDGGGGSVPPAGGHGRMVPGAVSVADLTGPGEGVPDVSMTLVARAERISLADGTSLDGYTIGDSSPGPTIEASLGDLVEVTLVNESVEDGVTLHWHGLDVPNAEDGVAGVTQDAVPVGGEHVYRFVVDQVGTYWYHSHQVSHSQVRLGLFGAIVVRPEEGAAEDLDIVAPVHTYGTTRTIAGGPGESRYTASAGSSVRVRLINTDNGAVRAWVAGAPYRLLAVDGADVHGPAPVEATAVLIPAGGRADVGFTVPIDGSAVRVQLGGGSDVVVGPEGAEAPSTPDPATTLDLLSYGSPADLGFDPTRPDRSFEYRVGRRFGVLDGRPGLQWTVNGHTYPDVPMFLVAEGDVVRMTLSNSSGQPHPMHLHGHHVVVLSRDGVAARGSPWWTDSLEVANGETYDVAFVADNPGIWMDHCHNLPHSAQGLVAHLAYIRVSEPFLVGGTADNSPE